MQIANPIYDVVFKYLMDDNKIAKLLISKIIGEQVSSLDFKPTESVVDVDRPAKQQPDAKASFTVYRLDFAATIKNKKGEHKQVLIEIQKAKFPTDIMRFRRYLGQQYLSESNAKEVKNNKGKLKKLAFPIISIYFLGHRLAYSKAPVIKVNRKYTDLATGEELMNKEEFIESLTHDSYVIQIPELKGKRRTELEQLLSIFDQSQKGDSKHILNINEEDYPGEFRSIIRKLQKAILDKQIQETMTVEDEVLAELEQKEREIGDLVDSLNEKNKALDEKNKALDEKNKALDEKNKEIERLKKMLGNK